jgi:hypothetical protein
MFVFSNKNEKAIVRNYEKAWSKKTAPGIGVDILLGEAQKIETDSPVRGLPRRRHNTAAFPPESIPYL